MNCLITQKVTLFFECLAIPVFYSVAAQFVTAQCTNWSVLHRCLLGKKTPFFLWKTVWALSKIKYCYLFHILICRNGNWENGKQKKMNLLIFCVVCSSSIYRFWLPLRYLQTLLTVYQCHKWLNMFFMW
jgi:hypothetical protein